MIKDTIKNATYAQKQNIININFMNYLKIQAR